MVYRCLGQNRVRQGKALHGMARHDTTRRNKVELGRVGQGRVRQGRVGHGKVLYGRTWDDTAVWGDEGKITLRQNPCRECEHHVKLKQTVV